MLFRLDGIFSNESIESVPEIEEVNDNNLENKTEETENTEELESRVAIKTNCKSTISSKVSTDNSKLMIGEERTNNWHQAFRYTSNTRT